MHNIHRNKCRLNAILMNKLENLVYDVIKQNENNHPGLVYYTGSTDIIHDVNELVWIDASNLRGASND